MPPKPIKLKRDRFGVDICGRIYGPLERVSSLPANDEDFYFIAPGHNFKWSSDGKFIHRIPMWFHKTRDDSRDIIRFLTKREIKE